MTDLVGHKAPRRILDIRPNRIAPHESWYDGDQVVDVVEERGRLNSEGCNGTVVEGDIHQTVEGLGIRNVEDTVELFGCEAVGI